MNGKLEIGNKHMRSRVLVYPQLAIVCEECDYIARSWKQYGAHVDELVNTKPKTKQEAIMSVLSDHLGGLDGGFEDALKPYTDNHGIICCGCGWTGTEPIDNDEFRVHLADEILIELDRVQEVEQ